MMTRDQVRLFGLDTQVELNDLEDVVGLFEWYTGMPVLMERIKVLYNYSRDMNLEAFFLYLVRLDSQSHACLSEPQ